MTEYQRMLYPCRHRFFFSALYLIVLFIFIVLIFFSLRNQINFFRVPSEITQEDRLLGASLRIGGYVEKNSLCFQGETGIFFKVTDLKKSEKVFFNGILPDLFREEQGIIVEGKFSESGLFIASRVLAKHDEKYIPKEMTDTLKQRGI